MDRRVIILYAMYGWLQLAAANTSEELAIKRYTTQPLQHYRQQAGNSRIECSALCKADMNNQCTGFSFNRRTCFLFNALCASSLTDGNMNAEEVFVFQESSEDVGEYEDCHAALQDGCTYPGVYTLRPAGFDSFDAWCDFDESNGWTVIQRRTDGSVDFVNRDWVDFKEGFGDVKGELWLGNDKIHALTLTNQKLSIYLRMNGADYTANYSTFSISDEGDNYRLTISGYSGDLYDGMAEQSLISQNGMQYSTRDRDNDLVSGANCAVYYSGAWWHSACATAHLNARWPVVDSSSDGNYMLWLQSTSTPYTHPRGSILRISRG